MSCGGLNLSWGKLASHRHHFATGSNNYGNGRPPHPLASRRSSTFENWRGKVLSPAGVQWRCTVFLHSRFQSASHRVPIGGGFTAGHSLDNHELRLGIRYPSISFYHPSHVCPHRQPSSGSPISPPLRAAKKELEDAVFCKRSVHDRLYAS